MDNRCILSPHLVDGAVLGSGNTGPGRIRQSLPSGSLHSSGDVRLGRRTMYMQQMVFFRR